MKNPEIAFVSQFLFNLKTNLNLSDLIRKDICTLSVYSFKYYPRMAVSSLGASNFEPAGWCVVGIRIKRVIDDTIVRIDA
jgi:hypothetical protein